MAWSRARHERPSEDGVPSGHWVFQVSGCDDEDPRAGHRDRPRGVVAASTGNHGAAVAEAGFRLKIPVHVFVPESVSASKLSRIETRGAEVSRRFRATLLTPNGLRAHMPRRMGSPTSPRTTTLRWWPARRRSAWNSSVSAERTLRPSSSPWEGRTQRRHRDQREGRMAKHTHYRVLASQFAGDRSDPSRRGGSSTCHLFPRSRTALRGAWKGRHHLRPLRRLDR